MTWWRTRGASSGGPWRGGKWPPEGVKGLILDVGWGTYGFKAGPVSGKRIAELIATGRTPDILKPFRLSRFAEGRLVGEKAAAAVSH